jgi:hypothetical protein
MNSKIFIYVPSVWIFVCVKIALFWKIFLMLVPEEHQCCFVY